MVGTHTMSMQRYRLEMIFQALESSMTSLAVDLGLGVGSQRLLHTSGDGGRRRRSVGCLASFDPRKGRHLACYPSRETQRSLFARRNLRGHSISPVEVSGEGKGQKRCRNQDQQQCTRADAAQGVCKTTLGSGVSPCTW